jgi:hypothetical protein
MLSVRQPYPRAVWWTARTCDSDHRIAGRAMAIEAEPFPIRRIAAPPPMESPDGHTLFFASDRSGDLDIWVAYRATENGAWESPEPLPGPVNTLANEFCPTALPGDRLLFVSTGSNACGGAGNNRTSTSLADTPCADGCRPNTWGAT